MFLFWYACRIFSVVSLELSVFLVLPFLFLLSGMHVFTYFYTNPHFCLTCSRFCVIMVSDLEENREDW